MEPGAALHHCDIYCQYAFGEGGQDLTIQPSAKHRALRWVATLDQEHADFQLQESDDRDKQAIRDKA